ncbi:hypothetical protein IKF84_00620 [Candidatus Saccharibacteria bacterium]|nr:hypothetical protein [Candidatus Saccharibacteria bacterium]
MRPNLTPEFKLNSSEVTKRSFYARLGAMALAATLLATPATAKNHPAKTPIITAGEAAVQPKTAETTSVEDALPTAGEAAAWSNSSNPVEEEFSTPTAGVEAFFNSPQEETSLSEEEEEKFIWDGPVLNAEMGLNHGPTGEETFYNLPMDEIVARMHRRGVEGDYWVREDGVKMLGDYVMVAADLKLHPRGSIVETSLGTGIVCDTGGFIKEHPERLDIATDWEDPRRNKVVE